MTKPIVRFAPSPTGYLHIGGARTALFNYLFAKSFGGKFLLRIEDTDSKRSTKEAIDAIYRGLEWLGINYEEPAILQSRNLNRHRQIAYQLLEKDKAYYCYTSAEELAEARQKAEAKGEVFRFKSPWRNKSMSQSSQTKPVIRIKAPEEGTTTIADLIQGTITVNNQELDDLVMLRSDDTPTYMLAVVVDDHDMEISHIIRGDDHLTNAFRQKIIFSALDWQVPEFAHIPLIYGNDGTKMSKRHGATSVIDYKEMGYLPQAIRNYLLRLGWSHNNDEIISDEQAINWFNLENIGKSPARFDFDKLNHLNKHYLKALNNQKILDLIKNNIENNINRQINSNEESRTLQALDFLKEKATNLNDFILPITTIYCENNHFTFNNQEKEEILASKEIISLIISKINTIDDFTVNNIKEQFKEFSTITGYKIKDFGPIIRLAITGSHQSSGGIFENLAIIGKELSLHRLNFANNFVK